VNPGARLPGVLTGHRSADAGTGRSAILGGFLSFVWPGLGQWYEGRSRSAVLYAAPMLVVVAAFISQALGGFDAVAADLIAPSFALTIAVLVILLAAWRILSIADAMAGSGIVHGWRRGPAGPVFASLVVATLILHGLLGYYAWSFYQAGRQIFVGSSADGAPTMTPALAGAADPSPPTDPLGTSGVGRISVLVTGIDDGSAKGASTLTETMLVASIDLATHHVTLISFPRDIAGFPLYDGGTYPEKLNSLMAYATAHPQEFPSGGLAALKSEAAYLLGISVDYYASIDMGGFQRMVAAVGGVDVVNPTPIADPAYDWGNGTVGFQLAAGPAHLDGAQALAYARSPQGIGTSDLARSARQEQLLVALRAKLTQPAMIPAIPGLLQAAGETIRTDFPSDEVSQLLSVAKLVGGPGITQVVLGPPYAAALPLTSTAGVYTLRLDMSRLAALSVQLFGKESRYAGGASAGTGSSPGP
jgi:LCP family protein required for cell wall assembly